MLPYIISNNYLLNDVEIQVSHTVKYLGIFLDDRLSFKTHIDFLVPKISRSVGIMIKLRPYLPTETLTALYYALGHSHILYRPAKAGQPLLEK